ncbi:MAG: zinc ABC transporter substrate-binding protein [Chloroflexi bacterium]|nr:zinc ABC transporter substrate-binding protein [Chloroflexota bacterium]
MNPDRRGLTYRIIATLLVALLGIVALPAYLAPQASPASPVSTPSPSTVSARPTLAGPAAGKTVAAATTLNVFADMIRQVGGDRVEVQSLVPAGTDVHTFQPTPKDVQLLASADVVFINGLGLDGFAEKVIASVRRSSHPVVVLSAGLEPLVIADDDGDEPADERDGEHHDEHDGNPHLWLDPRNGIHYVERIRDGLIAVDPDGRATYAANAERYVAELLALDRELEQQVATIPAPRRKLVTFHDAFPYLARRYGFELIGVVVKAPEREPSAQEVAVLATQIRQHGVPTVYAEPQMPARVLEVVARDAGVKVGRLYSDALDATVPTYVDLLRFDVQQLVEGLR